MFLEGNVCFLEKASPCFDREKSRKSKRAVKSQQSLLKLRFVPITGLTLPDKCSIDSDFYIPVYFLQCYDLFIFLFPFISTK